MPFRLLALLLLGGANEKSLFLPPSEGGICLGNISGSKFCTKACLDGKSCGIPTHATRKFKASSEHVYILEAETKAFCEPRLEIKVLEDKQLAMLLSQPFPKEQWASIFTLMECGSYPDWLLAVQSEKSLDPVDVLSLQSPKQAAAKTGIFDVFPTLSYDEGEDVNEAESSDSVAMIQHSIQDFRQRFARLKHKWQSALQDVEVGHLLVTNDIARLSDVTYHLVAYMGQPLAIDGTTFTNIWQALVQVNSKL